MTTHGPIFSVQNLRGVGKMRMAGNGPIAVAGINGDPSELQQRGWRMSMGGPMHPSCGNCLHYRLIRTGRSRRACASHQVELPFLKTGAPICSRYAVKETLRDGMHPDVLRQVSSSGMEEGLLYFQAGYILSWDDEFTLRRETLRLCEFPVEEEW